MVPHACFLAARARKNKTKMPWLVLVRARTAVKILLRYSTGKIKSNPLEPHFQTWATMSRCLERTKSAVALPHCILEHLRVHRRVVHFGITSVEEVVAERRNVILLYKKNTQLEVLPVVHLCKKSAKWHFFLWAMQHLQVVHFFSEEILYVPYPRTYNASI